MWLWNLFHKEWTNFCITRSYKILTCYTFRFTNFVEKEAKRKVICNWYILYTFCILKIRKKQDFYYEENIWWQLFLNILTSLNYVDDKFLFGSMDVTKRIIHEERIYIFLHEWLCLFKYIHFQKEKEI